MLGAGNHLTVVAGQTRARATGTHRAGIQVDHRKLTGWIIFELLRYVVRREHLLVQIAVI